MEDFSGIFESKFNDFLPVCIANETEDNTNFSNPENSGNNEDTTKKKSLGIEDKLKEIEESLEELRNLQLLNQLDIINLKNQIDTKKFVTTGLSQEDEIRLKSLVKLAQDSKELEKIRRVNTELQTLKEFINQSNIGGQQAVLSSIKKEFSSIEERLENIERKPSIQQASPEKQVSSDVEGELFSIKNSLGELARKVNMLESKPAKVVQMPTVIQKTQADTAQERMTIQSLTSEIGSIKDYMNMLTKRIDSIAVKSSQKEEKTIYVPDEFKTRLDELNRKINDLSNKPIQPIQTTKIVKSSIPKEQLQNIVDRIEKMHSEMEHIVNSTKIDEIEKMIQRNKSIESRLKTLSNEIHGIELIHPLETEKREIDPEIKRKFSALENRIKAIKEKTKPMKENEKIDHMEKKIETLEDEVNVLKTILNEQKLLRKKMLQQIKKKIIKLSKY